jgi:hypothetical protein
MNKDQLLKRLSRALSKADAVKIAKDKTCLPKDLIDLSFDPPKELAFRASWVLEQFLYSRFDDLLKSLPEFIAGFLIQKNRSCQRQFSKIMMYLVYLESIPEIDSIIGKNKEQIVEITFDWLIDSETPVAVQVNCMDILFPFAKEQSWIQDELRSQVQFLLKDGSAALQSRGKRILKKLKS